MNHRYIILKVNHNMELAHRLYTLPGKCQNIHGHSMQVTLEIAAEMGEDGYALGSDGTILEFSQIKRKFRHFIDSLLDHHLHLNEKDPWASPLSLDGDLREMLPGLVCWPGDPSTENLAKWIYEAMSTRIGDCIMGVLIAETGTNGVEYRG